MQAIRNFFTLALPWLLLMAGLISLTIGSFVDFPNDNWEKYFSTIGGSILASGIFALILKTIQFMGVFKEELNNVIFETKFLKNRIDLPIFWEKVTKELVKDKFPTLHNQIMKDVIDTYLPTNLVHYYDNSSDVIDISVIDKEKQMICVVQKTAFTIIPGTPNKSFFHPFRNSIKQAYGCNDTSLVLNYVKINNKEIDIKLNQVIENGFLKSFFDVPLGDKNGYAVEICMTKKYSLLVDNVIGYSQGYIQNNYKLQMLLKGVKVTFHECGTLNKFKDVHDREELLEKHYVGLIYKRQGYITYLQMR